MNLFLEGVSEFDGIKEFEIIVRICKGTRHVVKSFKYGCYSDINAVNTLSIHQDVCMFMVANIPSYEVNLHSVVYEMLCLYNDGRMKVVTIHHRCTNVDTVFEYTHCNTATVNRPRTKKYRKLYNTASHTKNRYGVDINDFGLFRRHFKNELKLIEGDSKCYHTPI